MANSNCLLLWRSMRRAMYSSRMEPTIAFRSSLTTASSSARGEAWARALDSSTFLYGVAVDDGASMRDIAEATGVSLGSGGADPTVERDSHLVPSLGGRPPSFAFGNRSILGQLRLEHAAAGASRLEAGCRSGHSAW